MVIIIEGPDAVGKSTQIGEIVKYFQAVFKVPHILHYSNVKAFGKNTELTRDFSVSQYNSIFKFIEEYAAKSEDIFIFDRCHLSEYVYSPMYRNYDGYYVFASERRIKNIPNVCLVLLTDKAENIIERDKLRGDGESFSLDVDKKKQELQLFDEAFGLSDISHKLRIEVNGQSIEEIYNIIIDFINDMRRNTSEV